MNSFIPWIGGKSQLRRPVLQRFPKDLPKRYIEVFGGAGWILFSREKHAHLEVFNDIDGHLINLYRCIQHHCSELQRELLLGGEQIPPNLRELFFDYLEQLNVRGLTDIQRAARYFYVVRVSYGADRRTFSCHRAALMGAIERLPEIQERLQDVVIENRDFEAIMKTYDDIDALLYLDPPYYNAEKFYQGFGVDDHARLLGSVQKLRGRFVLSYNDHPVVRDMYKDYHIHEVERMNSLNNKKGKAGKYMELIITNFEEEAPQPE